MSISATIGLSPPTTLSFTSSLRASNPLLPPLTTARGVGGLIIECSSRPNKKATSHHMKTRPRKTQPWDVRRKPTVYPPLPPLPPDWTLLSSSSSSSDDGVASATETSLPSPPL
ncbi:50S ribosomal protein 6, chloroplastic [Carica papaya]|uniref:50S ribosomal protein 6, chloroplastic n=1 Tax=Carica papaya TaxID=3649 RepID=UPI000B8CCDB5|nr:50S ribosomal protein 6, chloroplastic [Carica papaya]